MDIDKITQLWNELLKTIREYESDTFSASGCNLTVKEAQDITNILAQRALVSMIDLDTLDGVEISEIMDEFIRPADEE